MKTSAKITLLADNVVSARGTTGEHGLSFWIEVGGNCLLFDTGQGAVIADNARALNVDLDAVDAIVLSHGHYDHTGGLAGVLRQAACEVRVHAHPDLLLPKYHCADGEVRDIGVPAQCRDALAGRRCRLVTSRGAIEVLAGVWATGEIPRRHPEEAASEGFCRDAEGRVSDPLLDDQAIFFETAQGTVVLLGCAHAGPINTLDHVVHLTGGSPIRAVLGGMHLGSASEDRLAWTVSALKRFGLRQLAPMHCTGMKAAAALCSAFPDSFVACGTGMVMNY